jgi:hypothetical protein
MDYTNLTHEEYLAEKVRLRTLLAHWYWVRDTSNRVAERNLCQLSIDNLHMTLARLVNAYTKGKPHDNE